MTGSRGEWVFTAVTIINIWGATLADRNTPLARIYAVPELFIVLAYRRALAVTTAVNFGLAAVQALDGEPTPDNLLKWAVAVAVTVVLTRFLGKPIDLLAGTNMRNQELVEQLQAHDARIAYLSHLEKTTHERERIARGMHDTIVQGLVSVLTLVRAVVAEIAQVGGAGPSAMGITQAGNTAASANGVGTSRQASRHLAMIVGLAQGGLNDTRRMIADTDPRALNKRGLTKAVGRTTDRLKREGIAIARSLDSTFPPLPQPVRAAILRIAQEAVADVARHFRAANVAISLRSITRVTVLEVHDDGVGFDPAAAGAVDTEGGGSSNQAALRSRPEFADEGQAGLTRVRRVWQRGRLGRAPEGDDSGFGIPDMRGGAADLGGSVSVDNSPGPGTRVLARIPVEAPAVKDAASAEDPTSRETTSQTSQEAAGSALQGKEKE